MPIFSNKEGIPLQVNISTLGQFAVSVAAISIVLSAMGVCALIFPMASQLSPTDRKIHLWMLNHIRSQGDTIFGGLIIYLKIHLTIIVGYIWFCFHIWISLPVLKVMELAVAFGLGERGAVASCGWRENSQKAEAITSVSERRAVG